MVDEHEKLKVKNEEPKEGEPEFWENEVVKENAMLELKYQELCAEIEEKSTLMSTQLEGREGSTSAMEQQITEDIQK
jgi:hypothetical protein